MFERIQGLTPERAARLTAVVLQCRAVLAQGQGMDEVQRLLRDLGVGVIDSIVITRELLGGHSNLGRAKEIVLTSPGRADALQVHRQLMDTLERARDIADAAERSRAGSGTTIIAIDGPSGAGKTALAAAVA
jgi:hypothetical protein